MFKAPQCGALPFLGLCFGTVKTRKVSTKAHTQAFQDLPQKDPGLLRCLSNANAASVSFATLPNAFALVPLDPLSSDAIKHLMDAWQCQRPRQPRYISIEPSLLDKTSTI
ncbi:hypothetical protein [Pseudomonas asplenii]|uniref:hypothetical protein n=1 Tax=Pseudomonas asplenii TaxID=53407 RepID=UPI0012FB9F53|nr:hypothetical protein [Pseudomonas fuscovaginae]